MIFIHILTVFGITLILVESYIFEKIRQITFKFTPLLSCFLCTGFWVGLGYSYFFYSPNVNLFLSAIFYSTTTWIIHLLENGINEKTS